MDTKPVYKRDLTSTFNVIAVGGTGLAAASIAGAALIGPLAFAAPWMLSGLAALPPLWWLMRSLPPKPLEVSFAPMLLLFDLVPKDQQPARMPLWQRLLRTTAAAAIVLGLSQPQWNPDTAIAGKGPVMLVVDSGWASARHWSDRVAEMNRAVERAERENRPVIILPTAPSADGAGVRLNGPLSAQEARGIIKDMKPEPWPVDRHAAAVAAANSSEKSASILWLSDGLDDDGAAPLAKTLHDHGSLTLVQEPSSSAPRLLLPPDGQTEDLSLVVRRLDTAADDLTLSASDETGHVIAQAKAVFKKGEVETRTKFIIPVEIRNQLARVTIDGDNAAGSTVLLDERWRRRPVGLVEGSKLDEAQSLLSETNYIERAIAPYVDLHGGSVDDVMKKKMAVMIVTDSVVLSPSSRASLDEWVQNGGTLLRFSGPHLAAENHQKDGLLPVELREGSRAIGGMADGRSGKIVPFEKNSPFYGLKIPDNVTIDRQVLAQPGNLDEKTWARLEDGSPLVTAKPHGMGWVILVHTTANRDWSNLALSGLFIDMLRTVVAHAQGVGGGLDGANLSLPPIKILDGAGKFHSPLPGIQNLTGDIVQNGKVDPRNPPGFYGNESLRAAHNLAAGVPSLKPLAGLSSETIIRAYDSGKGQTNLGGVALAAGLSLLLADLLILLAQRGAMPAIRLKTAKTGLDKAPRM